jgi:DNA repair exonuclease SbcCD ATPase subunit
MPTLQSSNSDSQILTLSTLQASLEEERNLRQRAESNLTQTQSELEELTAQLFGQANEMVATERKARAKLEERVKVLEQRDVEKRRRLERLEKAVARIDRVKAMVEP